MGPVWRVVFITGLVIVPQVEKSVRSTSRYTPRATNERKVALCFMLGLQQQQDVQVFFCFCELESFYCYRGQSICKVEFSKS